MNCSCSSIFSSFKRKYLFFRSMYSLCTHLIHFKYNFLFCQGRRHKAKKLEWEYWLQHSSAAFQGTGPSRSGNVPSAILKHIFKELLTLIQKGILKVAVKYKSQQLQFPRRSSKSCHPRYQTRTVTHIHTSQKLAG